MNKESWYLRPAGVLGILGGAAAAVGGISIAVHPSSAPKPVTKVTETAVGQMLPVLVNGKADSSSEVRESVYLTLRNQSRSQWVTLGFAVVSTGQVQLIDIPRATARPYLDPSGPLAPARITPGAGADRYDYAEIARGGGVGTIDVAELPTSLQKIRAAAARVAKARSNGRPPIAADLRLARQLPVATATLQGEADLSISGSGCSSTQLEYTGDGTYTSTAEASGGVADATAPLWNFNRARRGTDALGYWVNDRPGKFVIDPAADQNSPLATCNYLRPRERRRVIVSFDIPKLASGLRLEVEEVQMQNGSARVVDIPALQL